MPGLRGAGGGGGSAGLGGRGGGGPTRRGRRGGGGAGVPAELLDVLREARRNAVRLRALQQRKEAAHVVELGRRFKIFDELRQRASRVVSPGDGGGGVGDAAYDELESRLKVFFPSSFVFFV